MSLAVSRDWIKWSRLKRLYASTNLNSLFFATFTTLISVLATTALPAAGTLKIPDDWVNLQALLTSLVLFFLSSIFWYSGLALYEVAIPLKIAISLSVDDYVEKAIDSPTLLTPEAKADAAYSETQNWDQIDKKFKVFRVVIVSFGVSAGLFYVLAMKVFFESILGFLLQINLSLLI